MRPISSTTCSRPPICTAAVATTSPFSTNGELGRAAADVDVEDALVLLVRHPRGARAVGRQHRLHVMAGGRGDEVAALLSEQPGDRLGVLAPQRLAGEDDDAGVDLLSLDAGIRIGLDR